MATKRGLTTHGMHATSEPRTTNHHLLVVHDDHDDNAKRKTQNANLLSLAAQTHWEHSVTMPMVTTMTMMTTTTRRTMTTEMAMMTT